jgi:excisionase family DNA binding protein
MDAHDRLLTVPEVAAALRVDDNTVRRWIRRGRIEAHNLGGRTGYRVRRSELDRFLSSLSTQGRAAEARSGS